jgi:hypothetical protein
LRSIFSYFLEISKFRRSAKIAPSFLPCKYYKDPPPPIEPFLYGKVCTIPAFKARYRNTQHPFAKISYFWASGPQITEPPLPPPQTPSPWPSSVQIRNPPLPYSPLPPSARTMLFILLACGQSMLMPPSAQGYLSQFWPGASGTVGSIRDINYPHHLPYNPPPPFSASFPNMVFITSSYSILYIMLMSI